MKTSDHEARQKEREKGLVISVTRHWEGVRVGCFTFRTKGQWFDLWFQQSIIIHEFQTLEKSVKMSTG